MPRLRLRPETRARPDRGDVTLELMIGPTTFERDPAVEELAAVWEVRRGEIMRDYNGPVASRPWAWWVFDRGEEKPRSQVAEAVRLAELGQLTDDELAVLRERADEARLRVGTARERVSGGSLTSPGAISMDQEAIALFEAVRAV